MVQEKCRLCGKSNQTFTHSLNDKLITDFLMNTVVSLCIANSNKNVCNLCFAKAKIVVNFVDLVNKTQSTMKMNNTDIQNAKRPPDNKQPVNTTKNSDASNFVDIKQEFPETPNVIFESELEDNSNLCQSYFSDSEEPPQKKVIQSKPSRSSITHDPKKSIPQKNYFKCANCKQDHDSFAALEAHIVGCFKATVEYKCFVCHKQYESRKKLSTHMSVHRKDKNATKAKAK